MIVEGRIGIEWVFGVEERGYVLSFLVCGVLVP